MLRVSIRNTFLSIDSVDHVQETAGAMRRCRSAEFPRPQTLFAASTTMVDPDGQAWLTRLNAFCNQQVRLLPEVKREALLEAPSLGARRQAPPWTLGRSSYGAHGDAQQQHLAKTQLKQVHSNNSVSTMAPDPDDWEYEEWHQGKWYSSSSSLVNDFQHCRVPRREKLAEKFSQAPTDAPPTTMMIRNIPNRYSQRELIRELETLGFAGTFDFFYAPIDAGTLGNVGYAFVNFIDPAWAAKCNRMINGYPFRRHQQKHRKKVASVSVAHLQGLQANIQHYQNAAVNVRARNRRCGPVIMTSIAHALEEEP